MRNFNGTFRKYVAYNKIKIHEENQQSFTLSVDIKCYSKNYRGESN